MTSELDSTNSTSTNSTSTKPTTGAKGGKR